MEDNENNINIISTNKDINSSFSTTTKESVFDEKEDALTKTINEYKPEEITLNKKIIIESINIYNTISTNYGDKKLEINRLSQEQQDKALLETDIFF